MANLFKTFEDSMTAAAFAEAGEHEAAQAYLNAAKTARKKVLLGTNATEIPPTVFSHAVEVCKRLDARLEILHVVPAQATDGAVAGRSQAKMARLKERFQTFGIPYEYVVGAKKLEEEIIRYAAGRRDIMLIVLGLHAPGRRRGKKQPDSHLLARFQCPVVLLTEPQPA
ncbi:MAG TPA: universal stress protein [Desulfurivibrionaceae bacterium]|nr:universal stress protein [Desulfurivibrionaceae bacterium]